jgi:hypothetical protein
LRHTPLHSDGSATIAGVVGIIAGIIFFASSKLGVLPATILQLTGIILITVGAYFLIRYRLTGFSYVIKNVDGGAPDFIVERAQGKNSIVIARVGIEDIKIFKPVSSSGWKKDEELIKLGSSVKTWNYCVNLHPPNPYLMITADPDGTFSAIVFEPNAEMIALINNYSRSLPVDPV